MWSQAMLKLVFALIVLVDNEEILPEGRQGAQGAYWSSIYVCARYAEAVEKQLTSEDDPSRRLHYNIRRGSVHIESYCVPKWVDQNVQVFDH